VDQVVPVAESTHRIRFTVNARPEEVVAAPRRTLLQVLRENLGLTGAKEGCGVGTCGACTVLVDGRAVLACLMLAVQAADRTIETVEGIAQGDPPDPLLAAFVRHDALQCGFCTPGQVMALRGLLRRAPGASAEEIRRTIDGNVCRCGTYLRIQAAAAEVAAAAETATDIQKA